MPVFPSCLPVSSEDDGLAVLLWCRDGGQLRWWSLHIPTAWAVLTLQGGVRLITKPPVGFTCLSCQDTETLGPYMPTQLCVLWAVKINTTATFPEPINQPGVRLSNLWHKHNELALSRLYTLQITLWADFHTPQPRHVRPRRQPLLPHNRSFMMLLPFFFFKETSEKTVGWQ